MRSHQFNRNTPKNVVGADIRRFGNEFNSGRKQERFLGAKQFSSSKTKDLIRISALLGASSMRFGRAGATGSVGADGSSGRDSARSRGSSGARDRDSINAISANSVITATGCARATGLMGAKRRNNAWFPSRRFLRSVVGMVVGGLLVMNTYTSAVEKRKARQVNGVPYSTIAEKEGVWNWSGDFTAATFYLPGRGELPVVITISEEIPPTCTEEGIRTYLATAEVDGKTHTDTQTETLPPTGHTFDQGSRTGNGIVFPCTRCGEQVSIGLGIKEEE